MSKPKPKIALLTCGGTISMVKNLKGVLAPALNPTDFLKLIPQLNELAQIDAFNLFNLDSTNLLPQHWQLIATKIFSLYSDFDGFVITHGTDTLAYTSTALSFALQYLDKPVVLTGSQKPIGELTSDARLNLIHAFQTAIAPVSGVKVVFGTKVFAGNRVTKNSELVLNGFSSPHSPPVAHADFDVVFNSKLPQSTQIRKLNLAAEFDANIAVLSVFPGFDPKIMTNLLSSGIAGLILVTPASGNVPHEGKSLIPALKQAALNDLPVVIATQCRFGHASLSDYEAGMLAKETGVIAGLDMTLEACIIKLMWVLGQTRDINKIKNYFTQNLVGEVSL